MSDTFKHKNFGKMLRGYIDWEKIALRSPRYFHSRSSKNAKFMIQKVGHKRRRTMERKVSKDLEKFQEYHTYCTDYDWYDQDDIIDSTLEFYDEGKHLNKDFIRPYWYH